MVSYQDSKHFSIQLLNSFSASEKTHLSISRLWRTSDDSQCTHSCVRILIHSSELHFFFVQFFVFFFRESTSSWGMEMLISRKTCKRFRNFSFWLFCCWSCTWKGNEIGNFTTLPDQTSKSILTRFLRLLYSFSTAEPATGSSRAPPDKHESKIIRQWNKPFKYSYLSSVLSRERIEKRKKSKTS